MPIKGEGEEGKEGKTKKYIKEGLKGRESPSLFFFVIFH